ncbi:hypothetical protein ACIQCF_39160 [Streptomyces sp. NPDC088353]|uniref:hypothetical protein n=1 Tax=unclassified Streptomyces TaxID=2593676 RepID=UPI003681612F
MGRTGSCSDNAAAESFFALLKQEIGTRRWPDRASARADIFAFVETFYNRQRLRRPPRWGYLAPLKTRQRLEQEHALVVSIECPRSRGSFTGRAEGAHYLAVRELITPKASDINHVAPHLKTALNQFSLFFEDRLNTT